VDTVLAKIYAKSQKSKELHVLIAEPSDIVVDEVESIFLGSEQYVALCRLYEREGEVEKLLDAWAS
jgi:vacuolar protein sorting-associated protein 3